jgi:hypothetical protein
VSSPVIVSPGRYQLGNAVTLSITEDELVNLYDICGRILHTRNPFSQEPKTHQIGHTVGEWLARLEGLLRWHYITQVTGSHWFVEMPNTGSVHVYGRADALTADSIPLMRTMDRRPAPARPRRKKRSLKCDG